MITPPAINEILFNDWDPVNVSYSINHSDQYHVFVPELLYLLTGNASKQQVEKRLQDFESELSSWTSRERREMVAHKLISLRERGR